MDIQCLDAALHNRPERIAEKLDAALSRCHGSYDLIFIAYADCGTQGGVDRVAAKFGAQRLEGAHCYEFFASSPVFHVLADAEPGTFYLTDFLVRAFRQTRHARSKARFASGTQGHDLWSLSQGGLLSAGPE